MLYWELYVLLLIILFQKGNLFEKFNIDYNPVQKIILDMFLKLVVWLL